MSEFCVKCSEKEAEIESLRFRLYSLSQMCDSLQKENERLVIDLAFYDKNLPQQLLRKPDE